MTKINGGYLERPVFLTEKDTNVCDVLNFHKIGDDPDFEFKQFKKPEPDPDKINYTRIAPLFKFLINIKKKCLKGEGIITLQDVDGNNIFISENVTDDNKLIHIFKLTTKYQILYKGEEKYSSIKETIYKFDNFINDNRTKLNDKYSLFDMKMAYDNNMILNIYKKYNDIKKHTDNILSKYYTNIEKMNEFEKFMGKYCTPQKNDVEEIISIIYHENYNIINFMAFVNMMPELFELIELDYKHYNDYDNISEIFKDPRDMSILEKFIKNKEIINKLVDIDIYDDIHYDLYSLAILNATKERALVSYIFSSYFYTDDNFDYTKTKEYILEHENIIKTQKIKEKIFEKEKTLKKQKIE